LRPIESSATARQGALPTGLRVAVHHLGPFLLGPKETRQAMTGLRRARNGKDKEQSGTSGKHRVQPWSISAGDRHAH